MVGNQRKQVVIEFGAAPFQMTGHGRLTIHVSHSLPDSLLLGHAQGQTSGNSCREYATNAVLLPIHQTLYAQLTGND